MLDADSNREIWRGSQWLVRANGDIEECADRGKMGPPYWILGDDLAHGLADVNASWPVHLAEKRWVDLDDFEQAYRRALKATGISVPNVDAMFDAARELSGKVVRLDPSERRDDGYANRVIGSYRLHLVVPPDPPEAA